ncbi:hypothetical protein Sjap_021122 [Stephania japonica]|uniref:Membrane insertase YidC/Oxa/ALB C-terminal domain-containing protein n=1 Tax=Stephania japonica TaxID=461633 RepID=A0AAP0F9C8_9MAGN
MAYRRGLCTRIDLFRHRFGQSMTHILHRSDDNHRPDCGDSSRPTMNDFLQRGYCSGISNYVGSGFGSRVQERRFVVSALGGFSASCCSYSSRAIGEGGDGVEYMSDVAGILSDEGAAVAVASASQAPVVNEVAVAAADSFYPVAALQYLIDGVHSFTSLNWWASIAIVAIMIRGATIPFLINQLKATTKLTLMRPHLEEIKQQMQDAAMDPKTVADGQRQMKELFKEYGVTPFTPLRGLLIQGPLFISFFLAISNMVEKVPSFKEGGAFWFTDLTSPDSLYILPVLTSLTFLITVECNMQEGLEGNPVAATMKNFSRVLAVLAIPFTMSFPKALFCYWITSNMFSLVYGQVIKRPQVKEFLGIPIIPAATSTGPKSGFSPASTSEPPTHTAQEPPPVQLVPPPTSAAKTSSSSIIRQRLKTLEKQVKSRSSKTKKSNS